MRRTASNCQSPHSWGYITPTGKFIEVDDHSKFAIRNPSILGLLKIYNRNPEIWLKRVNWEGEDVEIFDNLVQAAIRNTSAFRTHAPNGTDPKAWEKYGEEIVIVVESFSYASLLEAGWLVASNAYGLGGSIEPTDQQLNVFFRQVLECWKELGLRPKIEKKQFALSVGPQRKTNSYMDALEIYCSRKLQDEFYNYLLN